jgi:hypothetical protein
MIAAMLIALAGGCVAMPRLFSPGSENKQQARAQIFEPYPEPDTGPPVVGARPREYQTPQAEVLRVQPRIGEPLLVPVQSTAPPPVAMAPVSPMGATPTPPPTAMPPTVATPGVQ